MVNKASKKLVEWKSDHVKDVIRLWPDHTIAEIAEKIGVSDQSIYTLVKAVRKQRPELLPTTTRKGRLEKAVSEALRSL